MKYLHFITNKKIEELELKYKLFTNYTCNIWTTKLFTIVTARVAEDEYCEQLLENLDDEVLFGGQFECYLLSENSWPIEFNDIEYLFNICFRLERNEI